MIPGFEFGLQESVKSSEEEKIIFLRRTRFIVDQEEFLMARFINTKEVQ